MKVCGSKSLIKLTTAMVSVGLIGGLSACSTTSVSKVSEAAPVTYRIGQGNSSYAAVRMPQPAPAPATGLPHTAPSTSPLALPRPQQPAQQLTQAQPQPAPSYDLSNIDRGLYDHMKVGKPYKVAGQTYYPKHNPSYDKIGVASWYGDKFHGKPTANGEVYDKSALTAAHKTLPLNSYVIVTNIENGKSIKVRLNDRGPFIDGRIIDLSEAAAGALNIRQQGTGRVRVQYAGAAQPGLGASYTPQAPVQLTERSEPETPPVQAPLPTPVPAPVPAPVVETPVAETQAYRPLRDGGSTSQTQESYVAAPEMPVFAVPNALSGNTGNLSIALPDRSANSNLIVPIPDPILENTEDDDIVTLTIKGPVHIAKSTNNNQEQPEVIPAVYEEE